MGPGAKGVRTSAIFRCVALAQGARAAMRLCRRVCRYICWLTGLLKVGALKTCFLLAAVVNAFSVRRILRAFHRRGEDDRKRAQLFALIAKACKEQIKSANYTIGRRIDHQSTPFLLRDE